MRHSAPLPRAIFPTPLCATKNPNFGPLLPKFPFAPVEITEIVFLHKFSDRKIWRKLHLFIKGEPTPNRKIWIFF